MVKFHLITLIVLIPALGYAQDRHYSLSECGNDPLLYIERNYEQNKARYIGKTIGVWADECQLHLEEVIPGEFSPWERDKSLIGKIELVYFPIYFMEYEYSILIILDAPYTLKWDDGADLGGDYTSTWGTEAYNFYKNAKIKDIYILKIKDGRQIENYFRQ